MRQVVGNLQVVGTSLPDQGGLDQLQQARCLLHMCHSLISLPTHWMSFLHQERRLAMQDRQICVQERCPSHFAGRMSWGARL